MEASTVPAKPQLSAARTMLKDKSVTKVIKKQCDQIGRFIGLWASF